MTLLLLALGEGVARVRAPVSSPPDVRIQADTYGGAPWVAGLYDENARSARLRWGAYGCWRRQAFAGDYINVDAGGRRRTWRAADVGPHPLRVFVFGGSTVWGTGVRDDHTIPSELAQYLAAAGVPAEVENEGESGYVSTQDVVTLLRALQRGDVPDVAVFYLGANDTFSSVQNGVAGVPQNEEHRVREFNLLRRARRLVLETARAVAARSALARAVAPFIGPAPVDGPAAPALVDETLRALDANLAAVRGLAAQYGFTTSVFWQPSLLRKPHRTAYEEERLPDFPAVRDGMLAVYERVGREWPARQDDGLTDLADLFADVAEPRFVDRIHTGEVADREIAAAIGRRLVETGRLRHRTPPG